VNISVASFKRFIGTSLGQVKKNRVGFTCLGHRPIKPAFLYFEAYTRQEVRNERGEIFLDTKLLLESFQTLVVLLMYAKSLRGLKGRGNPTKSLRGTLSRSNLIGIATVATGNLATLRGLLHFVRNDDVIV